jgi:hypothetical protein
VWSLKVWSLKAWASHAQSMPFTFAILTLKIQLRKHVGVAPRAFIG